MFCVITSKAYMFGVFGYGGTVINSAIFGWGFECAGEWRLFHWCFIPFLFNTSGNDLDELFAYIDDEYNKIANNNNCRYLSMYQLFKKNTNFLPNPADIHPNLDGYQEMANQIYSFYRGK